MKEIKRAVKKVQTFPGLRKEERERRKAIILDAAERVYESMPYNEVNIRKIAAEAGISAASIYTYFKDQQDMFLEISERRARRSIELAKKIIRECDTDVLRKTANAFIEYDTYNMFTQFVLHAQFSPKALKKITAVGSDIRAVIEEAMKKSKVPGDLQVNALLFQSSLNGILVSIPDYPGITGDEAKKLRKLLISTLCNLFLAGKGVSRQKKS
ncbi:MAG: TetR/AcrR family transcriptional regulator [Dehalococcoidia bacterium]|nr:TetR/AcrR family transcriptional regulator [Dehalococcoidia bacterium]